MFAYASVSGLQFFQGKCITQKSLIHTNFRNKQISTTGNTQEHPVLRRLRTVVLSFESFNLTCKVTRFHQVHEDFIKTSLISKKKGLMKDNMV